MINLVQKEKEILAGLKDFQRATVERVFELIVKDYSRVLVADEVGLGKTMIARGVIAKTARYFQETLKDDLFKVVYVCSNQSIAGQNLAKLKIDDRVTLEHMSDTRLSMQHLKIFEDQYNPALKENYIQLIPLTPSTSFNLTGGRGSVAERSLIFAILRRYQPLEPFLEELEILMKDTAFKGWDHWAKNHYEEKVQKCNANSNGEYIKHILQKVEDYFTKNEDILEQIKDVCTELGDSNETPKGTSKVIHRLRKMMAEISVDLMDPDLVIMDEFQRFPELIKTDDESETALLANKFFNSPKQDREKVKILLLSATPYKLYTTLEEMTESQSDDHYKEFMQVTDFLFEHDPNQQTEFKEVWNNFSIALSQASVLDFAVLSAKKQQAEDSLYKGIARTERMLVKGASELIDTSNEQGTLQITERDILSYVELDNLLQEIGLEDKVPVDYVKSAPFLMSYMEHYKLKQKIFNYFSKHPNDISLANKRNLWVTKNVVSNYRELPETNARLVKLKEIAIPKQAEKLMWIPPSVPYYEFGGPYKGMSDFSKVLVFSAWEMVPRAIATLLSYESERLTVGELIKKSPNKTKENKSYFAKRRFPAPRLTFAMRDHAPANMNQLCLLYPSITLSKLFDPIRVLNEKKSLVAIKEEIRSKLNELLSEVEYTPNEENARRDERWYYIAPLLLDRNEDVINEWFQSEELLPTLESDEENNKETDKAALLKHFEQLRDIYLSDEAPVLGRQPEDLLEVLVNMAIGSPAICGLRVLAVSSSESIVQAIHLGKTIIDRFNTQEAISIVELEYGKGNDSAHWQNVLSYCVDGNIQAMLDEYSHMLLEEGGLYNREEEWRNRELTRTMIHSLKTHSASFNVDTFNSFKERTKPKNKRNEKVDKYIKMRTNYAVGFYDMKNEDKSVQRKDNIRLSFNSPFRPFVLATTSIGQEGLDFHYYCRKIMHWNLPSNPIDLEQREGRINRYKCLAIRQNIAKKYNSISFNEDIWSEMFAQANIHEKGEENSELVPFWSLPADQKVKIERIVPVYPLSRDGVKYERLIKILSLYRLSLGQARQEELLEYIFENNLEEDKLNELFMNLSPFYKGRKFVEN